MKMYLLWIRVKNQPITDRDNNFVTNVLSMLQMKSLIYENELKGTNHLRLGKQNEKQIHQKQGQQQQQKQQNTNKNGKIQGDGRKFLDHFKLFWVTNIITIIKWGPYLSITAKIRNKRWFKKIYFCLWLFRVGIADCKSQSQRSAAR